MDLLQTLRSKVGAVDTGAQAAGLKAVLGHIEVALGHLSRGQLDVDEPAFTDAIYRCNQAFEGSIKEAYRVLAGKDPSKQRPHEIEQYLEEQKVFRGRVLSQFTAYRRDWRNPSTHDYLLDFNDSEAFLAIVSVSAFACVLIDQISQNLAFTEAQKITPLATCKDVNDARDLFDIVAEAVLTFVSERPGFGGNHFLTEAEIAGAFQGFVAKSLPFIEVSVEKTIAGSLIRPDFVLGADGRQILVEIKRVGASRVFPNAGAQIEGYLQITGIHDGILLMIPGSSQQMEMQTYSRHGKRVAVILPSV